LLALQQTPKPDEVHENGSPEQIILATARVTDVAPFTLP
jgi:hypothetical protein